MIGDPVARIISVDPAPPPRQHAADSILRALVRVLSPICPLGSRDTVTLHVGENLCHATVRVGPMVQQQEIGWAVGASTN